MLAQQAAPNLHSLFLAATSTLLAATAAVAVVIRITSALFASFIIRDIQHVPFGRVSGLDLLHFASLSSTAYTQYTDIGYAAAAHGHGHGADENIQKKKPELTRCTFFPPLLLCENLFQDLMHTNFFHKTAHALRAMIITLGTSSAQHEKHTKHLIFAVKRNSSLFSLNYFHLSIRFAFLESTLHLCFFAVFFPSRLYRDVFLYVSPWFVYLPTPCVFRSFVVSHRTKRGNNGKKTGLLSSNGSTPLGKAKRLPVAHGIASENNAPPYNFSPTSG